MYMVLYVAYSIRVITHTAACTLMMVVTMGVCMKKSYPLIIFIWPPVSCHCRKNHTAQYTKTLDSANEFLSRLSHRGKENIARQSQCKFIHLLQKSMLEWKLCLVFVTVSMCF